MQLTIGGLEFWQISKNIDGSAILIWNNESRSGTDLLTNEHGGGALLRHAFNQ